MPGQLRRGQDGAGRPGPGARPGGRPLRHQGVCQDIHEGERRMRGRIVDIGYARVSTTDQNPQLQLDALERAGCWPIFEEKVSGVALRRPVRDEALAQLQPSDTLTVWKLDRLGRSATELLTIIEGLHSRGVRFRCLTQPIDTTSPLGKMFLTLLAAFAEFERELMRERVIAGKARMKAEGRHPGGPRMFGYAADHETLIEAEAELLREAARRALAGEPVSRVVEDWDARGLRPLRGERWKVTSLRRVLLNDRAAPIVGAEDHRRLVALFRAPGRQSLRRAVRRMRRHGRLPGPCRRLGGRGVRGRRGLRRLRRGPLTPSGRATGRRAHRRAA